METRQGSLGTGIGAALFLAGPIFLATAGLAEAYMRMPRPIVVSPEMLGLFILVVPAMIVGCIISLPANLVGALTLGALADHIPLLRPPIAWTMTGLLLGVAIIKLFDVEHGPIAFGLVATSALCARICRHWIDWTEPPMVGEEFVYRWTRSAPPLSSIKTPPRADPSSTPSPP